MTVGRDLILALYAAGLLAIWFLIHRLTEASMARIAASVLSDLIWLPLGVALWAAALSWLPWRVVGQRRVGRALVVIAAVVVSVAWHLVSPEWAFRLLLAPLITMAGLAAWRWRRSLPRRRALVPYLLVAVIVALTIGYYRWQLVPGLGAPRDTDLKVMTYNILNDLDGDREQQVLATIRAEAPDVLCCQEYRPTFDDAHFQSALADLFPYRVVGDIPTRRGWSGGVIYSRHPLRQFVPAGWDTVSGGKREFVFAELQLGDRTVNIVNFHLLNRTGGLPRKQKGNRLPLLSFDRIEQRSARKTHAQYRQALYLVRNLDRFRDSTILCGDLNDTANSAVFRAFASEHVNAFSRRGWGLGDTFGAEMLRRRFGSLPSLLHRDVLRIDHVFVTPGLEVVSSSVVRDAQGSDHKPLVAVVRIAPD